MVSSKSLSRITRLYHNRIVSYIPSSARVGRESTAHAHDVRYFSRQRKQGNKEALEYLQTWIGKPNHTPDSSSEEESAAKTSRTSLNNESESITKATNTHLRKSSAAVPLFITGSSYLLPTLRIQRNDTPTSLARQLDASLTLAKTGHSSTTMLLGKSLSSNSKICSSKPKRWKVPLVLDLTSFQPDGSPHFIPPTQETLEGIIQVFQDRGIQIMGITNPPNPSSGANSVVEMVHSLGLPSVTPIRSRGTKEEDDSRRISIEDVICLIRSKEEEEEKDQMEIEAQEDDVDRSQNRMTQKDHTIPSTTKTINNKMISENDEGHSITTQEDNESYASPSTPTSNPIPHTTAKIYQGNVRTGQQITAGQNQSLLIFGSVHSGGEVMADADIYIYGKLKGRALAGLNGDSNAKIVASQFDPELVCIGGCFTTVDDVTEFGLTERGCSALVSLDLDVEEIEDGGGERLNFTEISL